MERIYLTKEEKKILISISERRLTEDDGKIYADVISSLEAKKFVVAKYNYYEVIDAKLTLYGGFYLRNNPKLHNPINWQKIISVSTTITAIVSLATLILNII